MSSSFSPSKTDLPEYIKLCNTRSDINEHLHILSKYASKCSSVLEAGVRNVVSTWAFVNGMRSSYAIDKNIYSVDIDNAPIQNARQVAKSNGINLTFTKSDILEYNLKEYVDLLFIDTFHCYGQLKRELTKFAPLTRKYIIMHDTTIDGTASEIIRNRNLFNVNELKLRLGWSEKELTTGLWPAVTEFLNANADWKLHFRFIHNNGLTILKRKR